MRPGRTYTLTDDKGSSKAYFEAVGSLVSEMLMDVPEPRVLLKTIRGKVGPGRFLDRFTKGESRRRFSERVERSLSPFTGLIDEHLKSLSLADRLDPVLRTSRTAYFYYMVEVELLNRINARAFSNAPWRMALVAHCLRDFRPNCAAIPGRVEEVCVQCEPGCFVGSGSRILERHGVETFISVSMDHRKLFGRLSDEHPDMGVLGIACIPELVMGMRLCEGMGIPAVGVPLDANRCTRWMDECLETTFSLEEMERLLSADS